MTIIYDEEIKSEDVQDIKNWLVNPNKRTKNLWIHPPDLAVGIESEIVVCFIEKNCLKCPYISTHICSKTNRIDMSMLRAISRLIIAPIAKKPEVVCLNCKFWKILQYMNPFMKWFLERNRHFGWQLRNYFHLNV